MDIWRNLPPLAALRAFAAWVDCGSMTAAGAALNVSHAAISQQIRALEGHLGLALVDRSTTPPQPTAEGAQLAETARSGFGAMARCVAELTGADAARPLQVTTSPGFAASWLLPRLGQFRAAHPGISLMLDPTPALCALTPGGIDIALRYGRGDWPGLEAHLMIPTPLVVVAAPDLVRDIPAGDIGALTRLPWIDEMGADDAVALFDRHGLRREGGAVVALPGMFKIEAARAGQGIAITSRMFVQADIAAGRLRVLHEVANGKAYWLVHRPGVLRPAARAFAAWVLRESARHMAECGEISTAI
ncbi:LysR substrate-binding domain-containing protein [Paracoccaceae bacterium]